MRDRTSQLLAHDSAIWRTFIFKEDIFSKLVDFIISVLFPVRLGHTEYIHMKRVVLQFVL